jgi:hypothetical protein
MLVQNGMREFIFEEILIKETSDSLGDDWLLKYLIDVWPSLNIGAKHLSD